MSTRPIDLSWRPGGNRWPLDRNMPLEQVVLLAAEARAKAKRREPLRQADLDLLLADKLLRDCYATPRWVWRLAGFLLDVPLGGWAGDPFHNPWSEAAAEQLAPGAWVLDGRADPDQPNVWRFDGLATWHDLVEADGAPECDLGEGLEWEDPAWPSAGPVFCNGPHSDVGGWVKLAARAGRRRKVAALVPSDAVSWYVGAGMTCDAEVQLGRTDYVPPLGLYKIAGNERCSSLLLWDPSTRSDDVEPAMIEVRDDKGKLRRCPLRPGLRSDPLIIKAPDRKDA